METESLQVKFTEKKYNKKRLNLDEESYKEQFEKPCQVCYNPLLRFLPESSEIQALPMHCIQCGINCHMVCYGQNTQYEEIQVSENKKFLYFLCQKCKTNTKKQECVCCQGNKGLMKKINKEKNKWCHLTCALFSVSTVQICDFTKMEFEMKQLEELEEIKEQENEEESQQKQEINEKKKNKEDYYQQDKECCICNKTGKDLTQCLDDECDKNAHFYCVLQQYPDQESFVKEQNETIYDVNENWVQVNYTTESKAFPIKIKQQLQKELEEQLLQNLDNIFEVLGYNPQNPQLQPQDEKQQSDQKMDLEQEDDLEQEKSQQQEVKNNGDDITEQEQPQQNSENNQEIQQQKQKKPRKQKSQEDIKNDALKQFYKQIGTYNKKQQNLSKGKNYESYISKGGQTFVECVNHRAELVWCVCQGKNVNDTNMVACDCCFDWYHSKCLQEEFKIKNVNDQDFRCPPCEQWFDFKQKSLIPKFNENVLDLTDLTTKARMRNQIYDFIQIMSILDQRIEIIYSQAQNFNNNSEKSQKQLPSNNNIDSQQQQGVVSKKKKFKKFEEDLNEITKQLGAYPFQSTKLGYIQKFHGTQIVQQIVEHVAQYILQYLDTIQIKSIISEIDSSNIRNVILNEEQIENNKQVIETLQQIQKYFEEHGMNYKQVIQKEIKANQWLEKIHKIIQSIQVNQNKNNNNTDDNDNIDIEEQNNSNNTHIQILNIEDLIKEFEKEEFLNLQKESEFLDLIQDQYYNWFDQWKNNIEKVAVQLDAAQQQTQKQKESDRQISYDEYLKAKSDARKQALSAKLSIDNVMEMLRVGDNLVIDIASEKKFIEREIQITQDWVKEFNEQKYKKGDFEQCLDKMIKEINISCPEMFEALTIQDNCEKFQYRCQVLFEFLEQEEDIETILNNIEDNEYSDEYSDEDEDYYSDEDDSYDEEIEELSDSEEQRAAIKMKKKRKKIIQEFRNKAVSLEELQLLKLEGQKIPFKIEEQLQIQQFIDDAEIKRDEISDFVNQEYDHEEFRNMKKELQLLKFDFPVYKEFLYKIETYDEIMSSVDQRTPLSIIKEHLETAQKLKLGSYLIERLQEKVTKSEEIQRIIQKIEESQRISEEDVKILQSLSQKIGSLYLEMESEQQKIKNILNSNRWIKDVYQSYKQLKKQLFPAQDFLDLQKQLSVIQQINSETNNNNIVVDQQKKEEQEEKTSKISEEGQQKQIEIEEKNDEKKGEEEEEIEKVEENQDNKKIQSENQEEENNNNNEKEQEIKKDKIESETEKNEISQEKQNDNADVNNDDLKAKNCEDELKENKEDDNINEKDQENKQNDDEQKIEIEEQEQENNSENNNEQKEKEEEEEEILKKQQQQEQLEKEEQERKQKEQYELQKIKQQQQIQYKLLHPDLEDIIEELNQNKSFFTENVDKIALNINLMLKNGKFIMHVDSRINKFYLFLAITIWKQESQKIVNIPSKQLKPQQVEISYNLAVQYNLDQNDEEQKEELFIKIKQLYESWKSWKLEFDNLSDLNYLTQMLDDQKNHENLRQQIQSLQNQTSRVDISNELNFLKLFLFQINWVVQVQDTILNVIEKQDEKEQQEIQSADKIEQEEENQDSQEKQEENINKKIEVNENCQVLDHSQKISVKTVQDLLKMGDELAVDKQGKTYKQLEMLVQQTISLNREFDQYFRQQQKGFYQMRQQYEIIKSTSKDLAMLNQVKPDYQQTQIFLQKLNKSPFYFRNQIEHVQGDLDSFKIIIDGIQSMMTQNQIIYEDSQNNNAEQISEALDQRISELKRKYFMEGVLNYPEVMEKFSLYQLEYVSFQYLLGKKKNINQKRWKQIIHHLQQLPQFEQFKDSNLIYKHMVEQEETASKLKLQANEVIQNQIDLKQMREHKQPIVEKKITCITLEQLSELKISLDNSLINLDEEKEQISRLLQRIEKIFGNFQELMNKFENEGIKLDDIKLKQYQETVKYFPIQENNIERSIQEYRDTSKKVKEKIEQYETRHHKLKPSEQANLVVELVEIYKKCPVTHKTGETLKQEYENSQGIIQNSINILEYSEQEKNNLTQDQIFEITTQTQKIDQKFQGGKLYEYFKILLWIQEWNLIEQKVETSHNNLCRLLEEGYEILYELMSQKYLLEEEKDQQLQKIKPSILNLESLVQNVTKVFEEFAKNKDSNKVNQFYKHDGFIDLSEELLEYQFSLQSDPKSVLNYKKSTVYHAFNDLSLFQKKIAYERYSSNNNNQQQQQQIEEEKNTKNGENNNNKEENNNNNNNNNSHNKQQQIHKKQSTSKPSQNSHSQILKHSQSQIEQEDNNNNEESSQVSQQQQQSQSQQQSSNNIREKSKRQSKKVKDDNFIYSTGKQSQLNKSQIGSSSNLSKQQQQHQSNSSINNKKHSQQQQSNLKNKNNQNEKDSNKNNTNNDQLSIPSSDEGGNNGSDSDSSDLEDLGYGKNQVVKEKLSNNNVEDDDRNLQKKQLNKYFSANIYFKNMQNKQNIINNIENQIFGNNHKERVQYTQEIKKICILVKHLRDKKYLCHFMQKKNFEYTILKNFSEKIDKLPDLEKKLEGKNTQKEQHEPQIQKKQKLNDPLSILPKTSQSSSNNHNQKIIQNSNPKIISKQLDKKRMQQSSQQQQQIPAKPLQQQQQQSYKQQNNTSSTQNSAKKEDNLKNLHEDKSDLAKLFSSNPSNKSQQQQQSSSQSQNNYNKNKDSEKIGMFEKKFGVYDSKKDKYSHKKPSNTKSQVESQFSDDEMTVDNLNADNIKKPKKQDSVQISGETYHPYQNFEIGGGAPEEDLYDLEELSGSNQKAYKLDLLNSNNNNGQNTANTSGVVKAFLFNPDEEEDKKAMEEEEKKNKLEGNLKENKDQQKFQKYSVFKIGNLKIKFKKEAKNTPVTMYSTDSHDILSAFPSIESENSITLATTNYTQTIDYIKKKSKDHSLQLIRGWIEINDTKTSDSLIQRAIKKNQEENLCSGYKIKQDKFNITLNLFTQKQLQKLRLEHLLPKCQSINQRGTKFMFIIYIKKEFLTNNLPKITPKFVREPRSSQQQQAGQQQQQQYQSSSSQQNLSQKQSSEKKKQPEKQQKQESQAYYSPISDYDMENAEELSFHDEPMIQQQQPTEINKSSTPTSKSQIQQQQNTINKINATGDNIAKIPPPPPTHHEKIEDEDEDDNNIDFGEDKNNNSNNQGMEIEKQESNTNNNNQDQEQEFGDDDLDDIDLSDLDNLDEHLQIEEDGENDNNNNNELIQQLEENNDNSEENVQKDKGTVQNIPEDNNNSQQNQQLEQTPQKINNNLENVGDLNSTIQQQQFNNNNINFEQQQQPQFNSNINPQFNNSNNNNFNNNNFSYQTKRFQHHNNNNFNNNPNNNFNNRQQRFQNHNNNKPYYNNNNNSNNNNNNRYNNNTAQSINNNNGIKNFNNNNNLQSNNNFNNNKNFQQHQQNIPQMNLQQQQQIPPNTNQQQFNLFQQLQNPKGIPPPQNQFQQQPEFNNNNNNNNSAE